MRYMVHGISQVEKIEETVLEVFGHEHEDLALALSSGIS